MSSHLLRTKDVVDECEEHLRESGAFGTAIEAYLSEHVAIILCADVQQAVYALAERRVGSLEDEAVKHYVSTSSRRILRSVKKNDVATFVGMFGTEVKDALNSGVDEATVTIYNNAVQARHNIAHWHGARITFSELKNALAAAQDILDAIESALAEPSP